MNLAIELPQALNEQLASYCHTHGLTKNETVEYALHQFLKNYPLPTPYDLGAEGFGVDHTHSGNIARNSQRLLRELAKLERRLM